MRNTITASVQKEGFEAILYPGNGRKDKVMIVMSGSNGGMTRNRKRNFITETASLRWRWRFLEQNRHRKSFPVCRSSLWRKQPHG